MVIIANQRCAIAMAGFLFALGNVLTDSLGLVPHWYAVFGHWANLMLLGCALYSAAHAHASGVRVEQVCRPAAVDLQRLSDSQNGTIHRPPSTASLVRHFEGHISPSSL